MVLFMFSCASSRHLCSSQDVAHHGGCPSWEVEAVVAVLAPEAEATTTQNKNG